MESQNGADKPRDLMSNLLIGAFVIVAVVIIIMVVFMPPEPEKGEKQDNDSTSVSASALPSTDTATEEKQVPVIFPVRAQGLDESGSRVPLRVRGTEHTGGSVDEVAYAEANGSGISLCKGTYQVTAEGSPIAAGGTVYHVPDTTIGIVLDDKAVEEGYTQPTDQAISFEPVEAADVTEEQIAAAVGLCQADPGRSAQAEVLAQAARTRRDVALDPANCTVNFSDFDFVIPKAWRGKVEFAEDGREQWLEWEGWRMIAQAGEDSYLEVYEGDSKRTVILSNGGQATMIPWADSSPSPQDDPREIAFAAAQALAEGITVTKGTDPSEYLASHEKYDLVIPGPWRGKLDMSDLTWKGFTTVRLRYAEDLAGVEDAVAHHDATLVDSFVTEQGFEARIYTGMLSSYTE